MYRHNVKAKTNYRQALEEESILIQTKQRNKMKRGNKNITKNDITGNIRIMNKYY
jgi:hypothetical protein